MTEDLELRLRRELTAATLPRAPETLVAFAERANTAAALTRSSTQRQRVLLILGLAAATLLAVLGLASLLSGGVREDTIPSPVPTSSALPAIPAGYHRVSAPGVELAVPGDWVDETAVASASGAFGERTAVAFMAGSKACPIQAFDQTWLCPNLRAKLNGALAFTIAQYLDPLPGDPLPGFVGGLGAYGGTPPGSPPPINGLRAWTRADEGPFGEGETWTIEVGQSWYVVRSSWAVDRPPQVDQVLSGLTVSDWQPSPGPITDGKLHFDEGGIAFDYPSSWRLYYPRNGMLDGSLVLVSSNPAEACVPFPCYPDGTVSVEFRYGAAVPVDYHWSTATDRVGGQPAFSDGWWPTKPAGEFRYWDVQFGFQTPLRVIEEIQGAGNADLRAAADALVQSISLTPQP